MNLALRELVRRPLSFAVPVGILLLLATLLLYPTAVLDGINDSSTGALRALPGQLMVFSADSHRSFQRSRTDAAMTAAVAGVAGVDHVSEFVVGPLPARIADTDTVLNLGVTGTDRLAGKDAPDTGSGLADETLRAKGVKVGTVVVLGPKKVPVTVAGFVQDTNVALASGFFVNPDTMRSIIDQTRPTDILGPGRSLVLVVTVAAGSPVAQTARAIDAATGDTETVALATAISSLPGLKAQEDTFGAIRSVTLIVALVVVALFLSFVTLERMPLYAVLKALGASSRQLFAGVLAQVLAMSLIAVALGAAITFVLTIAVPLGNPIAMRPGRVLQTAIGLSVTAALGACLSLRRVFAVDPASAIG